MATKNSRKKESWWLTFPGVLTAAAGLITAIAGLVVALKNPHPGESPSSAEQSAASSTTTTTTATAAKSTAPVPAMSMGPDKRTIALPANAEAGFPRVEVVMKLISAQLEPFNAEKRSLRLKVRLLNNGPHFARTYYWTYRLLVDDLPRAPSGDARGQDVQAQSASEMEFVFEVPATAHKVVFRISRDEETRDIPLDLTLTGP
jgi:hypothetical protein